MGSHSRPKRHAYRNVLLSTAAGGILLTSSPLGDLRVAGGAPGTTDMVAAATLAAVVGMALLNTLRGKR